MGNILTKFLEKLIQRFPEKLVTDVRTDRRKDKHEFMGAPLPVVEKDKDQPLILIFTPGPILLTKKYYLRETLTSKSQTTAV